MTIQSTQHSEFIPEGDRNVYFTFFSFLTPKELNTCAKLSRKCRDWIKEFNPRDRLEKARAFIAEVMALPRQENLNNLSRVYRTILNQRPMSDDEWNEIRKWVAVKALACVELSDLPKACRMPAPEQFTDACYDGADEFERRVVLFDKPKLPPSFSL